MNNKQNELDNYSFIIETTKTPYSNIDKFLSSKDSKTVEKIWYTYLTTNDPDCNKNSKKRMYLVLITQIKQHITNVLMQKIERV